MSQANIKKVLDGATNFEIEQGRNAYLGYYELCRNMHRMFPEYTFSQVVAVFSALSPNNDFAGNVKSAISVLEGHRKGLKPEQITISTYGHCRDRAYSYLEGVDFWETSKGRKIRAFYRNISCPMDIGHVTIDGHAVNIWNAHRVHLKAKEVRITAGQYDRIQSDYIALASRLGLVPNQLQAITWFAWKRMHRILEQTIPLQFWCDRVHTVKPFRSKPERNQIKLF